MQDQPWGRERCYPFRRRKTNNNKGTCERVPVERAHLEAARVRAEVKQHISESRFQSRQQAAEQGHILGLLQVKSDRFTATATAAVGGRGGGRERRGGGGVQDHN